MHPNHLITAVPASPSLKVEFDSLFSQLSSRTQQEDPDPFSPPSSGSVSVTKEIHLSFSAVPCWVPESYLPFCLSEYTFSPLFWKLPFLRPMCSFLLPSVAKGSSF